MNDEKSGYDSRPEFDRKLGALHGLPDVLHTAPSNVQIAPNIAGGEGEHYIVQTYRQSEVGDFVFLTRITAEGTTRLALPPKVANAIARQRDQLTKRMRSKSAKRVAKERMERGERPAFLKEVKEAK